jgi:hypothetical protein
MAVRSSGALSLRDQALRQVIANMNNSGARGYALDVLLCGGQREDVSRPARTGTWIVSCPLGEDS